MRHLTILTIICLLAMSFCVQAQEDVPQYRLRVPTAEEYLAQLPDFTTFEIWGAEAQNQAASIVLAAEAEFLLRYGQDADFELLSRAYSQLSIGVYLRTNDSFPAIELNEWNARMIQAWLRENPTDLDSIQTLQFADYMITVEPRDFTGDGVHEWKLDASKGADEIMYRNYLVAARDGDSYRIIVVPISWSADGYSSRYSAGNPASEVLFEDLTADGVPEWVLSRGAASIGPGYAFYYGYTYVFTWHEGQIEEIFFLNGGGSFENADDDAALELIRSEYHQDNWGCGYTATIIYDWHGETFVEQPPQIEWGDCTARHAEEAMWAGDFATAAALYDEFITANLELYDSYVECTEENSEFCNLSSRTRIVQYFLVRRILAYALLGQTEHVENLLDELQTHLPVAPDGFTQTILDANTTDAQRLCQAAYDFYANLRPVTSTNDEMYVFIPGELIEDVNLGWDYFYGGLRLDPARAGCDINALNGTPIPTPTLTSTPYPTYPPPTPDTRSQETIWVAEQDVYEAFRAGDFQTVLTITQTPIVEDDFQATEMSYYRALALEMLNRPDEALEQYVAIYSAAPESAWGQLAALHLERVE